jgi:hypothetical protein
MRANIRGPQTRQRGKRREIEVSNKKQKKNRAIVLAALFSTTFVR